MQALARILPTLVLAAACSRGSAAPPPAREIDVRRAEAAGLRVIDGRYLRLATDLPPSEAVDELPAVFDAAVPLWAAYFGVDEQDLARSRWTAFLMRDRERFAALGYLPAENTEFVNGYARNFELWLVEQPSDYYRRHLLLHEGVHGFMQAQLGGAGPGWYMEGMAELLGTHEWRDGKLRVGIVPADRDVVPMWGRTKIVRDAFASQKAWPLESVFQVDNSRALDVESYAWSWALASLLDGNPQFRERFRLLKRHVTDAKFNERFRELFAEDWDDLLAEWEAYVAELDYGYDFARMAMVHRPAAAVAAAPLSATVAADRGWQSTGWLLKAGQPYRLSASGRYEIARQGDTPWPCEPGGVTLEYVRGRPLGALVGALRPVDGRAGGFTKTAAIGLGRTIRPAYDAVLYVRVNDSPAKLGDNAGELTVRIERGDQ